MRFIMKMVSLKVILSFKSPLPTIVQDAFPTATTFRHVKTKKSWRGHVSERADGNRFMELRWSAQGRFCQGGKGGIYCEKCNRIIAINPLATHLFPCLIKVRIERRSKGITIPYP
jgi:hypothetical protein